MNIGRIDRMVTPLRMGYLRDETSGNLHSFRLEDVESYRGESPASVGLKPGAQVMFDFDNTGHVLRVSLEAPARAKAATQS